MQSIQELIAGLTVFISDVLLPLLFGIALLFFVWNTVKFFIIDAGQDDAKDNAKRLALYGIGAFVLLVSLWGIVNVLISSLGWNESESVTPDLMSNDPFYRENAQQKDYCDLNPMSIDCR